jgi:hypothetical protein
MSYRLNKTNGELVLDLADGQIDNTSTDITLVGRNFKGFGEFINENFIKIVENFANLNPPDAPLEGQLWYDTNQAKLKVYNGSEFRPAGAPLLTPDRPPLVGGDLWIDNLNRQLYFYDGNIDNELTLAGPIYSDSQGKSGFEVETTIDISEQQRTVLKLFIGGDLVAVITDAEFRLSGNNKVQGYPDDPNDSINPPRQLFENGVNLVDANFRFRGTANSARALVDAEGNERTTANFLPADENGETTGSLFVKNANGVSIGVNDINYASFKLIGTTAAIETQQSNTDLTLRTRIGNRDLNAVYIDADEARVGIFDTTPDYTLDIDGDLRATGNAIIDGNLTVNGEATYINVNTLSVLDKNIELGLLDDSTEGNDNDVDNAGIIVTSSDGSKDFVWKRDTNSFSSNVNIDLLQGKEYKINGQTVLSFNRLPTVSSANNLSSIGTLVKLNVDDIEIDGNVISSSTNTDISFDPGRNISVSNSLIKLVNDPDDEKDAANKRWVEEQINSIDVGFALDITGLDNPTLNDPFESVKEILEEIHPSENKTNGTRARIHCTSTNNLTVTGINVDDAKSLTTVDVLGADSQQTEESVVQDITFVDVSGSISSQPTRQLMEFTIRNGEWDHDSTTTLNL